MVIRFSSGFGLQARAAQSVDERYRLREWNTERQREVSSVYLFWTSCRCGHVKHLACGMFFRNIFCARRHATSSWSGVGNAICCIGELHVITGRKYANCLLFNKLLCSRQLKPAFHSFFLLRISFGLFMCEVYWDICGCYLCLFLLFPTWKWLTQVSWKATS